MIFHDNANSDMASTDEIEMGERKEIPPTAQKTLVRTKEWLAQKKGSRSQESKSGSSGGPRLCFFYYQILNINKINTVGSTFACQFYVRAAWPEPDVCLYDDEKGREKLAAELDQWPGGKIKPFDPEFMFMNSDGDVKMTREKLGLPPGLWRVGPNGENIIEWSANCTGVFLSKFKLKNFPFDVQGLTISVGSRKPKDEVRLLYDDQSHWTLRTRFLDDPDFDFPEQEPSWELEDNDFTSNQYKEFELLQCSVIARRNPEYYIWNVFFQSAIFTSLSGVVFLYDPEKFGNRASITLTLLLVIVAKSFQLTTFLPRLRFLTLCDQFVRGAFNFLCLMILQNFIASLLAIRNAAAATPFDRITMWLMGIAWMLFLAYMAVSSYFLRQKELSKEPKPVYVPPKRN